MAEERIDLNAASAEALDRLPGIGPVLAQRIVDHRETHGPYERVEDLTSVRGIGQDSARSLADQLRVPTSAQPSAGGDEDLSDPAPSAVGPDAESEKDTSPNAPDVQQDEGPALDQERPQVEAVPPGESLSGEGLELSPSEGAAVEQEAESGEVAASAEEESEDGGIPAGTSFSEGGLPEEKEGVAGPTSGRPPGLGPEEEPPGEGGMEEPMPQPGTGAPVETKPASPWWRQLSWVWTAILGGLLGMVFALIAFAGINGSLDVDNSRAVLDIESDLRGVTRDMGALQADIDSVQGRLDALEDLTERMSSVESAVEDLSDQKNNLADRADALEEDIGGLSDDLQAVSENVSELQDQTEQARSFFIGLQTLLQDIFGEVEGAPMAPPTPTPEGK